MHLETHSAIVDIIFFVIVNSLLPPFLILIQHKGYRSRDFTYTPGFVKELVNASRKESNFAIDENPTTFL
jgi:hypothetical protein